MTAPSPVRVATLAVSAVFLVVGAAGFVPWVVTDYGELRFAGMHSHALLLGVFEVSILHNLVHLAFGVTGVLLGRTVRSATLFLVTGGVIYLLLWVYGLWIDEDSVANALPVNEADNWLHLVFGVGMIALGLRLGKPAKPARSRA
ncbi:DUF4383 domain-containing protein [Saccharothrix sp.]|uniref:DUF4383 domain-containing protein n=1 Tax=Saccharothrix sp. TaxID=1873460 RepID=UPI0028122344|nr:DUF4383 domain-containing protein [Saccharothrix sp.]